MAFSDLPDRVTVVRQRIAEAVRRGGHAQVVRLVAVTKTHGPEAVEAAWAAGIGDVGENKVQEALRKQDSLTGGEAATQGVRWHLIGHLQTNKAKALSRFSLFHALDRERLVEAADVVGRDGPAPIETLVQVNVSGEDSKGGFALSGMEAVAERLLGCTGLRVRGVMTMAPLDANERELRRVFQGARAACAVLKGAGHPATESSMGMSGDYEVAVEEGATLVRLGTVLFGPRS